MTDYVQMPLKKAALVFPALLHVLPEEMLRDDKYICRFKDGRVEIGYPSDEWYFE